jgi:hypothetical protein
MTTQVNWKRIRSELQRLADVEQLKGEVARIGSEIRKFDFHSVLSPAAAEKVKTFEKRYTVLMRSIHQAQRQMDREFNRILSQIKTHRSDVTKVVNEQKTKLEKVTTDFQKRFSKSAAKSARTSGTATRKRRRKVAGKKTAPAARKRKSKA